MSMMSRCTCGTSGTATRWRRPDGGTASAGITLIPGSIGNRGIFSSAFGRGQSVAEYKPSNRKAAAELATLMLAVYGD